MPWRMTLAVLAVALVNVAFGLDWQGPSLSPPSGPLVSVRRVAAPPPTPAAPVQAESAAASAAKAADALHARAQATEDAAPPGCHVRACAAHYKSFRAADCTYQPINGPRRQCRKR